MGGFLFPLVRIAYNLFFLKDGSFSLQQDLSVQKKGLKSFIPPTQAYARKNIVAGMEQKPVTSGRTVKDDLILLNKHLSGPFLSNQTINQWFVGHDSFPPY